MNGAPLDPVATYRVTMNSLLASGGDGFTTLPGGTDRATAAGFDVDALAYYLVVSSPVVPGPVNRITRLR